jgi:cytochrome c5
MRLPRPLACTAILLLGAHTASGQDPVKFFDDNCAMCHAIGGRQGAPDLKRDEARDRTPIRTPQP